MVDHPCWSVIGGSSIRIRLYYGCDIARLFLVAGTSTQFVLPSTRVLLAVLLFLPTDVLIFWLMATDPVPLSTKRRFTIYVVGTDNLACSNVPMECTTGVRAQPTSRAEDCDTYL